MKSSTMATENTSLDSIVCAAVDIASAEDRAAYVAQACGADHDLQGRVEKLVAAHFRAGNFLDQPVVPCLLEDLAPQRLLDQTQGESPVGDTGDDDIGFLERCDK